MVDELLIMDATFTPEARRVFRRIAETLDLTTHRLKPVGFLAAESGLVRLKPAETPRGCKPPEAGTQTPLPTPCLS